MESKSRMYKTVVLSLLFGSGLFFMGMLFVTLKIPFYITGTRILAPFFTGVLVGRISNYEIKTSLIICVSAVIIRHIIGELRVLFVFYDDDYLYRFLMDSFESMLYVGSIEILFSVFGLLTVKKLKGR